mmetsp:Transcript_35129/g.64631  ORF Transcript_35129/g.64631 Transcript_35129/m.64631 type:complete len:207 (-) Transcript_35129:332-952(-)|eukprot:CAMPEP_0197440586 /NCGR_PEP_ID=MMETSP1175-20131217/7049_1 /TAXON_ID=1003142 /ORGANISM="Triceratium dubium, Strain CCMP147" /LENGTH=206 /DNA_ID=CAMNT_0042970721 /DNA_START=154 /DNA_END=774 /DNA_ORIENTATION=-
MRSISFLIFAVLTAFAHGKLHGGKNGLLASKIIAVAGNKTACDVIHPEELPDECWCKEHGPYGLVIECDKKFKSRYFNDTIGMKIDVDPCNELGSRVSLDIVEKEHNIDYTITGIRAGEEKNIPIPGLSIAVPTIGHLGVDAAVLIAGNPDHLTLKIGLNACVVVHDKNICASSVPGLNKVLPWYVLSGTYSFGDICDSNKEVMEE